MTELCEHETIQSNVRVAACNDPVFQAALVTLRCADCGTQFHFRGLESGHPNPDVPVVSADGYELRCPILPGPGAIVGLLERTGLADKLVRSEPRTIR